MIARKLLVETNALPDHLQMSIMNLFEIVTRTQRMNQEHLRPRFMVNSSIKCQLPKCHLAVKPTTHPLVCSCLSELPLVIGSNQLSGPVARTAKDGIRQEKTCTKYDKQM